jgi:hypothetical protein
MVRAKFKVSSIENSTAVPNDGLRNINLLPVYDGSPENKEFFRWTPGGQIQLGTVNPEAAKQFEVGKEFYVDFTPAG